MHLKYVCFLVVISQLDKVYSDFQFCHNGLQKYRSNPKSSQSDKFCPGGILFRKPTDLYALESTNQTAFCVKDSLCGDKNWKCSRQIQHAKVQLLSHIPVDNSRFDFKEIQSRVNKHIPECGYYQELEDLMDEDLFYFDHKSKHSRKKRWLLDDGEEEFPAEESYTPPPQEIVDQTKRMFYFLAHLNPESVKSPLRVVALLEKTVELVGTICDPNFLNPMFMKEALRGFLFLLKEQGTERVMDVFEEDFEQLTNALDACATTPNPLTLNGETCAARITVESVVRTTNGKTNTKVYTPSSWSFRWGKYDAVVDAMWSAVDIVHGMCFATFRQNINLHHKYQVAMEELFKYDILNRWIKPLKLYKDYEYDHIFLAPVNKSMQILDACTEGAYISSPFLHRLKRPTEPPTVIRTRRSITDNTAKDSDIICLQSEDERIKTIRKLKNKNCPQ